MQINTRHLIRIISFLTILFLLPSLPAAAMCLPEDCEVIELSVEECESASSKLDQALTSYRKQNKENEALLDNNYADQLKKKGGLLLKGVVTKSRSIKQELCFTIDNLTEEQLASAEATPAHSVASDKRNFLYRGDKTSCAEIGKKSVAVLKQSACCDTIPPSEVECIFTSHEFIRDVPVALAKKGLVTEVE